MSFLADVILVAALVVTTMFVLSMQRRLKRLDASHAEYRQALNQTAAALFAARDALDKVNADGRAVAAQLGEEIALAKSLAAEIERLRGGDAARRRPWRLVAQGASCEPARHGHVGSLRERLIEPRNA